MSKFESAPTARSWRDIPQTVAPRAMSTEGRKRRAFSTMRAIALIVTFGAISWGGFEVWRIWQSNPQQITAPGTSEPVRALEVRSNGVLDHEWAADVLALAPGVGLMELDLYALEKRLLASGQVQGVVLTRRFPDVLVITLHERTPVVRIRAAIGDAEPQDFLVARDGTIFMGAGFSATLLQSLPWVGGVQLIRAGEGFAPLAGIDKVADLMLVAQSNAPALYRDWNVVDLSRFKSDGYLIVRSRDVPEIIFGTREDFLTQVAFLDATMEQIAMNPAFPAATRINLAVGGREVPVAFGDALPAGKHSVQSPFSLSLPRNPL